MFVPDLAEMRAELVVEPEMISFGKQMQIDLAHDEAVAIRIADHGGRSLPAGQVHLVTAAALRLWQRRLEKTFRAEPLSGKALLLSLEHDGHFFCVRAEDADDEIVSDAMRPQDAERIRMRAGEENVQFVDGHAGNFEGAHARFF